MFQTLGLVTLPHDCHFRLFHILLVLKYSLHIFLYFPNAPSWVLYAVSFKSAFFWWTSLPVYVLTWLCISSDLTTAWLGPENSPSPVSRTKDYGISTLPSPHVPSHPFSLSLCKVISQLEILHLPPHRSHKITTEVFLLLTRVLHW